MAQPRLGIVIAVVFSLLAGAAAQASPPGPRLSAPGNPRQGDPLLATIVSEAPLEGLRLALRGASGSVADEAPGFLAGRRGEAYLYLALLAIPLDQGPGVYSLVATGTQSSTVAGVPAQGFSRSLVLGVAARDFPVEEIGLDAANTALRTQPDPKKTEEAQKLFALLEKVDPEALYLDGGFSLPLEGARRSAGFGDQRLYRYVGGGSEKAIHGGLDFAVPVGTPVSSCAPGLVVFAAPRIVTGNTVIIEHLPGLYSIYMHLSSFKVSPGQVLKKGEVLGLSGKTGLATGPHLHWELRLRGKAVDPECWVLSPPLDK